MFEGSFINEIGLKIRRVPSCFLCIWLFLELLRKSLNFIARTNMLLYIWCLFFNILWKIRDCPNTVKNNRFNVLLIVESRSLLSPEISRNFDMHQLKIVWETYEKSYSENWRFWSYFFTSYRLYCGIYDIYDEHVKR